MDTSVSGGAAGTDALSSPRLPELTLTDGPDRLADWFRDLSANRETLGILTRKDFQTRYKRASFGVAWAVIVPILQASIMAIVFSKVIRIGSGREFGAYVLSGMMAYSYFSSTLSAASTAIVDSAALTDKVWFPRALVVVVPCLSQLVGFAATMVVVVVAMPFLHVHYTLHLLLLPAAILLLILFVTSLALVLSALHVYFRDVRFLVQAALLVWLYITPILYPQHLLGSLAPAVAANPLTGIIGVFHLAVLGSSGPTATDLAVSLGATAALALIGAEVQRRHDRLFVDLL